MAIQYSAAVRNNQLDQVESTTGTAAKLRILTGSPPANTAAAETGSLLIEITLPSDWMNAAAAGSKTKLGTWSGAATGTGTAGYFRVVDNAGTTCHIQGTCGLGSGDLQLDNTSITTSQTVTVNTFTLNAGHA
jgi:hypothetical protein